MGGPHSQVFRRPLPPGLLHSSLEDPWVLVPRRRHRTGSRGLTQPRQQLHAGIAVGRLHARLCAGNCAPRSWCRCRRGRRCRRCRSRARSGAAGFPALRPASACARRRGMAARTDRAPSDAVAEMHDRQRVVHRGVVASARHRNSGRAGSRAARTPAPTVSRDAFGCGNGWPSARVTPAFCHAS